MAELKYISPFVSGDGWLKVKNASGTEVSVPAGLQVRVDGKKDGRTNFTFMEGSVPSLGIAEGRKGSVWTIDPDSRWPTLWDNPWDRRDEEGLIFVDFVDGDRVTDVFDMLQGKLWIGARSGPGSRGPYSVRMEVDDVPGGLKPGEERWSALGIPNWPIDKARGYADRAAMHLVWFPIYTGTKNIALLNNEARYLHCGLRSAGCLSVDPDVWDTIYAYLILRRKGTRRVGGVHIRYKK
ncbi:hypothetical protein [Polyangium fumosum]|uniref:Uncharacterized protein n=1 Tax=Polyangium fumosum TaxID=889272 RepID=A0A4U1J5D7_9BACT|nr:hypothetical protein [Polyangium fumosum]TKD02440.1 hypothetical protein E8A74_28510 [Polyangium fumosum]